VRRRLAALVLAAAAAGASCGGDDAPPAAGGPAPGEAPVRLERVASGLDFPLALAQAGGGRLLVAEKGGLVRVIRDGRLLPEAFLDLGDRVSTGAEQGLLGIAVDPDFARNGRVVVSYTDTQGDSRVATFRVSQADPDRADPASERLVLHVPQPFSNHNGGHVAFGPGGYLYVGLGDGGSGDDPQGNGQDPSDLLGSLLRIDLGGDPYRVPPDNPFVGRAGFREEVWNLGLRNPWRFSFDRASDDLYIGDVGQGAREEIDVQPAGSSGGENYGWALMEGTLCRTDDCGRFVAPVLDYETGGGTCSVIGGYVYRGKEIPELRGHYLYSDFCAGWVKSFRYEGGRAVEERDWPSLAPGGNVASFGEDSAGELYILVAEGSVYRIVRR
jgi:glucose/arabinose dehydrogenase